MGIGYAWEKTMVAVTSMASNPDSIQERVAAAYVDSLMHIEPERDLPDDLRPLLAEIKAALTDTPAVGDEGRVAASARAMGREKATDVARKIVDLYDKVCVARPER
ncbi:hypothetical protein [Methylobacterium sp. Leaf100]|uniref:hypothetical protein n=1 Tax=Methylobacterium sp. Leaf100 TaxID=1736252 RepID=UPI0006FE68AE|nr:hypothetical protein [Methylobacterium sp. Leaf100]KQP35949.1 hypothetical protein ASF25_13345 [Methylobacterium sp. Leaf100]